MHEQVDNSSERPALPWVRAVTFGALSASIGAFGHALVMGMPVNVPLLVVATAVFALIARAIAGVRLGAGVVVPAIAVAQLLVHGASNVLADPRHAAHGAHAHHADGMASGVDAGVPLVPMVLVHVVAIAVGALVVLRLERAAWARVRTVLHTVAELVRRIAGTASHAPAAPLATAVSRHVHPHGARRWIAACLGRRGPPRASFAV